MGAKTVTQPWLKKSIHLLLVLLMLATVVACSSEDEAPPDDDLFTENSEDPGLPPPEVTIPDFEPPPPEDPAQVSIRPENVSLRGAEVGKSSRGLVIISNTGGQVFTVNNVEIVGRSGGDISIIGGTCGPGAKLASGETCQINLRFAPTSPEAGRVTDEILLVTDADPQEPVKFIDVTAQNTTPPPPPPPAPEPVAAAPPPEEGPSVEVLNMLEIMNQRRNGVTQILETPDASKEKYILRDRDQAYDYESTTSTLPVDRASILTADRFIPAVLETTINSELSDNARITAVVERNVYGADGRFILIPAGTRLVGTYQGLANFTSERIGVEWSRMLRPDGVAININNAPGTDAMGRMGLIGEVDRKYWDRFGLPLLAAFVNRGAELLVEEDGNEQIAVSTDDTGQITDAAPVLQGTPRIVGDFVDDASEILERYIQEQANTQPVITVAGGTRMYIMLREDVYFKKAEVVPLAQVMEELNLAVPGAGNSQNSNNNSSNNPGSQNNTSSQNQSQNTNNPANTTFTPSQQAQFEVIDNQPDDALPPPQINRF